ncbi:hypothetical protein P152DRAFT_302899 [Eremomyces bilateralis CBS 781.70]|uniref:Uncharacterized protein n=1 Tax=Eremomyces bilateralis CBS 781.70 TaxID=1392243 RepID=A0A6G1G7Z1_9PEZI|nr:uncharacterized protein P152DRAFT_302899 [Eremomyces bilateralis CBS 781.70]KAF1814056.1 hypothetical protein P152DRAFT_302899 [Eremomyces bilateralis CBS 781.70]
MSTLVNRGINHPRQSSIISCFNVTAHICPALHQRPDVHWLVAVVARSIWCPPSPIRSCVPFSRANSAARIQYFKQGWDGQSPQRFPYSVLRLSHGSPWSIHDPWHDLFQMLRQLPGSSASHPKLRRGQDTAGGQGLPIVAVTEVQGFSLATADLPCRPVGTRTLPTIQHFYQAAGSGTRVANDRSDAAGESPGASRNGARGWTESPIAERSGLSEWRGGTFGVPDCWWLKFFRCRICKSGVVVLEGSFSLESINQLRKVHSKQ